MEEANFVSQTILFVLFVVTGKIHVIVILLCSAPLASVAISVSVGVHLNCKDIIGIVWS